MTDEKLGLYVIKTFDDKLKPFDAPRKIDFPENIKSLRAFAVFKTSGASQMILSVITFTVVMASFMF